MRGGGGVLPALGPIRKAGGGGGGCCLLQAPSHTKSGGGGGGCCPFKARYEKRRGGGCCPALQARYKKRGRGKGCLAEEGALPYMKGGGATPKTPPPWIRLCVKDVSGASYRCMALRASTLMSVIA